MCKKFKEVAAKCSDKHAAYKKWKEMKYEKHCLDEDSRCYKLSETKCCKRCCFCCCGCCNFVKYILILINVIFFLCGVGLMGIGAYGVFKFDMGAGFLGFLALITGMMGAGSVFAALMGIQGARLRRKEGYTECGQFLLLIYIFGIATVMVFEIMAVVFVTFWCQNRVHEISALVGPDAGETINYNLGNNLANCSFNDCCPNVVGFESHEVSPGIWKLPEENQTWLAQCIHVYDNPSREEDSPAPSSMGFTPFPVFNFTNSTNSTSSFKPTVDDVDDDDDDDDDLPTVAISSGPSPEGDTADVTPLKKTDLIGNQQMCTVFESVQTYENCMDFYTYDQAVRKYLWSMVSPLQTFLLVVLSVEFAGFVAAWFSLLWCCGAGSMKIDVDDSDDDEHEWNEEEHHDVKSYELHHV
jgi:hypothetical protein